MKVLVVGTGGAIVSGISAAADEMARTLHEAGHQVVRLNAGERTRRRPNRLNLQNVVGVLADATRVARRARQADVVWAHAHGMPTLPALRVLALAAGARLAGRPVVAHLHAFGLEQFMARAGMPLRLVVRALSWLAGPVVVVHQAAADALRAVAGGAQVEVLPNWVEVADEIASPPPAPPLRAVLVGGLVRRKGVPELLEAMRALDGEPVELRLVGGAGEDGEESLARLAISAQDLVASGRVSFAGERDAAGVRSELQGGHLFVLPSEAEGVPVAMLEAMAEGRPALVTAVGGMGAVVEQTGAGWVLPDRDPATIAAWLRKLAGDPQAVAAAGTAARRAAVSRYSAAARRDQLARMLDSAARR